MTYDEGLVPTVCLSENKVSLFEEASTNGKLHGRMGSSKSTSELVSDSGARSRPPLVARSTSEVGMETKIDLSALDSATSDDDASELR